MLPLLPALRAQRLSAERGTSVLEVAVNDQLLALTKEQIPKLIKSATADDIQAECVLGMAYKRGITLPHDDAEAIKWLTKAAMHGVAWVQNFLGSMYRGALALHRIIRKPSGGSVLPPSNITRPPPIILDTCT